MFENIVVYIDKKGKKENRLGIDLGLDDKILIASPHPDDESLGCGGLIARYSNQCDVILFTGGGTGNPEWSYERTVLTRSKEFHNAMKCGNVHKCWELDIQSNDFKRLKRVDIKNIDLGKYKYIFVPNAKENHPEHRLVRLAMLKNIRKYHSKAIIMEYEVWTPLTEPTNYLDITDYIDKKRELIQNYQCQLKHIDYISAIIGLNSYRGMQYHIPYAESFKKYESLKDIFKRKMFFYISHIVHFVINLKHKVVLSD